MSRRIVVVGGGAAGMSAASAARRTDPEAEVTVLETGPFPSYGVCGLPYYLGGVVETAESLVAYPASEFRERRRIDLRLETPVDRIDLESQVVVDSTGEHHPYDALVFAAGAAPMVPSLPGIDDPRVVTIRRLDDAIDLSSRLDGVKSAAVVGAGYVGLEMAEALQGRGIDVTVIDRLRRVMTTVDPVAADLIEAEVRRHCRVRLDAPLEAIVPSEAGLLLHCGTQGSGESADPVGPVDLVVLALGVRPSTALLPTLAALPNGALLVDDCGRTSHPNVYAAGDCVAVFHRVISGPAYVPLGPAANKAGRVAGTVAAGGSASFAGVVGTAVVKVFDLTVAHTGLTLEECRARDIAAEATDVTAKSRAKYYPGAEPMLVRLVHAPEGRLLGAQMVGRDGVAQRIDVIATALQADMSVGDLLALDLAYAPPYSPVYDPLIQAAQAVGSGRGGPR